VHTHRQLVLLQLIVELLPMVGLRLQRALWAVAAIAVLAGCASAPSRWFLNGRSPDEFRADDRMCRQIAQQAVEQVAQAAMANQPQGNHYAQIGAGLANMGGLLFASASAEAEHANCLRSRGYTPAK
jgi:hypothetical protein